MATKVKLTDAEEWPQHNTYALKDQRIENWPVYRGRMIFIGPPEKPQNHWTCGTDVVWPVLGMADSPLSIEPTGEDAYTCVCRHQIQAGD